MSKQLFKDAIGWGAGLWLFGYVLGIVLFMIVPYQAIGWILMPIGIAVTLWVLFSRVKSTSFSHYLLLAISWTLLAVVLDFFFLVQLLNPEDGYYKLDVFFYYLFTFVLPLFAGWYKRKIANHDSEMNDL